MRAWTARRLGVGAFGLACVVLVFGSISVQRMADLGEAIQSVDRTLMLREETEAFLSFLKDAETGQRGFVITGDRHYLAPYDAAQASVGRQLERLGGLTGEMPDQHARVVALESLVRRKLDELRDTIMARERAGFAAAAQIVATGQGKHVMDEIRSVIDEMRAEEAGLLVERRAVAARDARLATATTLGGLAVAFGLLVAAGLLLNSAVLSREREHAARTTAQALAAVLAESETWLRVTLASIGDAVVASDEHGRVKLMNRVAESLTGWSEDDASGRALADVFVIVNEQSRRPAPNPADTVLQDRKVAGLANHTILIAKDGREIPIDDSAAPILTADGALLGVVLVFRDISGRRQLERERAVLLDNEQKAGRAKDVFLAALSHELRTPLTAVLGWVKMLRAGLMMDKAATERALDVIERNTRHQGRLIDDLLDVSRIVNGKLALQTGPVDLARLVESAADSMRPSADLRGISLTRVVDRTIGTVQGDAARLQQIVGNLLSNGVKFTPTGGGVEVRLVGAHDRARIIVTDTGRGIDAAFLPHVFEAFRQATGATGRADPGLGLGLARGTARGRRSWWSCHWHAPPTTSRPRRSPCPTAAAATSRRCEDCGCWWWTTTRTSATWSAPRCRTTAPGRPRSAPASTRAACSRSRRRTSSSATSPCPTRTASRSSRSCDGAGGIRAAPFPPSPCRRTRGPRIATGRSPRASSAIWPSRSTCWS